MANEAGATGRIFQITSDGADITGFDPARDKLDLGPVTVHNGIIVDTPTGVGIMNPWSGEIAVVVGVSLGQLTIDSFVPIINDHLRECVSGALAWEHGIAASDHTVYARSHEIGQIDRVAFNPATDTVDFRYFGTREQIYMTNNPEGVVISNSGTGQALILLGVTTAELKAENFVFYFAEAREDRVALQLGFSSVPDSQIKPQGVPIAGTNNWPTAAGNGAPPSGQTGTTTVIDWHYGIDTVIAFDPSKDTLDFGWFKASEFSVKEVDGSTVISIEGNRQTYVLTGVSLAELDHNNIAARDATARAEWQQLIDSAEGPAPAVPQLSVANGTLAEGNAGRSQMVFTVTLSQAATGPVSVGYTTSNGTATAGQDYASVVGTLTFAAGETAKTVSVDILGDTLVETNETFLLSLSSPTGATIARGQATGTIVNDDIDTQPDALPALSIADLSIKEGNGEHNHFMFVVTLDKASSAPVTVQYKTVDGSAAGGVDYATSSGTVTFAPGTTSQMIHVDIKGDSVAEADETFTVLLSSPVGATIADGSGTGTIINDDVVAPVLPSLSVSDATRVEGNSGTAKLNFTVSLSQAATGPVTVQYGTADGTASAGSDYAAKSGTLTFAAGQTSKTVSVNVSGDTAIEANETLTLNLSGASGATIADGSGIGTITNDDVAAPALPSLSVSDATRVEGNSGTAKLNFTVSLSQAATAPVTVQYGTADGTARAGSDYTAKSGTLTFAAGQTSKTISVNVSGDTLVETNETLTLNLSGASGATIADGSGTGTITNDDGTAPTGGAAVDYKVSDNWGAGFIGNMQVAAGETALKGWTVGFDAAFAITNIWNAQIVSHIGNHYVIKNMSYNGTVGANQETSFGFQATPGSDGTAATGFTLNGISSGSETPASAPVLPSLSISDATRAEGDSGTAMLDFTVSLSKAATGPVTVQYGTANDTASAGSDYTAKSGTLTFAAGEQSKVIQVAIAGDKLAEGNEKFTVTLTDAQGATIGRGAATATIKDDDTTSHGPSSGDMQALMAVVDSWNGGFNAAVSLHNHGEAVSGWQLEIETQSEITSIWNAEIVSHDASGYVVRNAAWNGKVDAEADVSFGFTATGPADPAKFDFLI
ncbi:cellulose binding domain-containing protein [Reyranella aquatilis]|uniref:Cellulose binding domain-containing protein n=1 Tax=Reyranella aquatilis TaxID=2035356 RepID=A0ABS8KWE6_9HYPH|nr:Calx-beta domain-containing protein [Reyranella aquatilis]MCC8429963.1 cellulose binding domain-containing protein [Reyranella aquatilis]